MRKSCRERCFIAVSILLIVFCIDAKRNAGNKDPMTVHSLSPSQKVAAATHKKMVHKKVLDNGFTILVRPVHSLPKVSVQLWYGVGSRDEKEKEKGIAHLIEHMIFKGTHTLSESDINVITHKLSGNCNAFTSYDYTGYLFNMPSHHWHETLSIMADCMQNCRFDDQMLNSEMKAVIQELKMYRDKYVRSLIDKMITAIFEGHPYHHPIIGYKQDLWTVSSQDLRAFYEKHYVPNNAVLVVVGDVQPAEVFKEAQEKFGHIPARTDYVRPTHAFEDDIVTKAVTIYRDISQPTIVYTFKIPGLVEKKDHIYQLLTWILGQGKDSRLYRKIVDELQLATGLNASSEELFEYGLFFIYCQPKSLDDIPAIEAIIAQELSDIAEHSVSYQEIERAVKQTHMNLYDLLEDFEHQAYEIGKYYAATGDENYIINYLDQPYEELLKAVQEEVKKYFRKSVMHRGAVLPIEESEKEIWKDLQQASDEEDQAILTARTRETPIEAPAYAQKVTVRDFPEFNFPKPTRVTLKNGLKLLFYHTPNIPKIDVHLSLKGKHHYDPKNKQGLSQFVSAMVTEGTKKHTAQELAQAIESRGMSFEAHPGSMSMAMLSQDLEYGLEILHEVLTQATFNKESIEKVRDQHISELQHFWDEPGYFMGQLIRDELYKDHPYKNNVYGTKESLASIKRDDLIKFYRTHMSPDGARIAIVGDLSGYDIPALVEKTLGNWKGPKVADLEFPEVEQVCGQVINYPINRDQVTLAFASKSIKRMDERYDKILIFDQIFGGSVMPSMSSKLFDLREETGLFYTITGSLIASADEQPGLVIVRTIVSLDRLQEAEEKILHTMKTALDTVTPQEFEEAKRAIESATVNNFASNSDIADILLFLERYNLPDDYFENRLERISSLTLEEVKAAVMSVLDTDVLMKIRIGRVPSLKKK